jgi:hypothetical protein
MPSRLRTPCAILPAASAAFLAGGCFNTRELRSNVLAGREARFAAWRSENRDEEVRRPTLAPPAPDLNRSAAAPGTGSSFRPPPL